MSSEGLLFGAGDDFFLQVFAQVHEVVAVAGDADDQVAVLFGMLLGLAYGSEATSVRVLDGRDVLGEGR